MTIEYNKYRLKANKIKVRHSQGLSIKRYTLYNPVNYKTKVRGYWMDDAGKLYRDYLELNKYTSWDIVKAQAVKLCNVKAQLCIFVKNGKGAYIVNPDGKVTCYFKVRRIIPLHSKADIRRTIRQYKAGLTIYKTIKGYSGEVYI